ncbi:MAG: cell division protein FtsW [Candidatus Ryanbacteria bacterium]|nr:cell division protein FtsW [Candidatus Ryanbacteria bacterium]
MTKHADKILLGVIAFLLIVGMITFASASAPRSVRNYGNSYSQFLRQLVQGLGLGGLFFMLGLRAPVVIWKKWAPLMLIGSLLIMLAMLTIPSISLTVGGATRWIVLFGVSFQPSELLKFAFIAYLAAWIHSRKREIGSFTFGLLPFLAITGIIGAFLLLEPDLGTFGVIACTSLGMFVMGGGHMKQVGIIILLGLLFLIGMSILEPYRINRWLVFLDPNTDPQGIGYQINQARLAIGSGGLWGRGVGLSRQKFYLPEPDGDAVFAVFAEEYGFIGVIILIGAFFLFAVRGMMAAAHTRDSFTQLLASGITLLVVTQAIINTAALSGLLPLTGIPLPFMSLGGTAVAFLLFEMGVLVQISKRKHI